MTRLIKVDRSSLSMLLLLSSWFEKTDISLVGNTIVIQLIYGPFIALVSSSKTYSFLFLEWYYRKTLKLCFFKSYL